MNAIRHVLEYLGLASRIAPFPIRRQARPWRIDEVPAGAGRGAPPDYIGVGTQKSGTSWWASLIESHPQIAPNRFQRKELHYLTHFFDRPLSSQAIDAYHAAFARPDGQRCGEWTPNYLASPYTLARIAQAAPNARILVMFRDPVDRFSSGFNHEYKVRFGPVIGPGVRMKVIKEYALRKESLWNGMYGCQSEVMLKHIRREQLLVLQYESCREDPAHWLGQTYAFLGVDPDYRPEGVEKPVNVQRRVTQPLSGDARQMLAQVYEEDVARLKNLFPDDINLAHWPAFAK